jgi:hypothetical protein
VGSHTAGPHLHEKKKNSSTTTTSFDFIISDFMNTFGSASYFGYRYVSSTGSIGTGTQLTIISVQVFPVKAWTLDNAFKTNVVIAAMTGEKTTR